MNTETKPKYASMIQVRKTIIATYMSPAPSKETLVAWFKDAGIPSFKSNPNAKRGGGTVYYSVEAIEKFLNSIAN